MSTEETKALHFKEQPRRKVSYHPDLQSTDFLDDNTRKQIFFNPIFPIALDKNLTSTAKSLYVIIYYFWRIHKYCQITNEELGKIVNKHASTVSNALSNLKKEGYIIQRTVVMYDPTSPTGESQRRRIYLTFHEDFAGGWDDEEILNSLSEEEYQELMEI